ncbi:MAG: DUF3048 domain-containing protein [Actinobacteria bacterium]|nr:DUF3048 domain-containing protein [Actinomycetota bacterium]
MTSKGMMGISAGVIAVALGAFFLLGNRSAGDIPIIGAALRPDTCPLSGAAPARESLIDRPAVAVKIENASVAYPLSGLEDAEVVYEELIEGGVTRFMAIYHCTDSTKAGPVRSARIVDPAIVSPFTKILAYSGQNAPVLDALREAGIVRLEEQEAPSGLRRIAREGVTTEHTLYADTGVLRKAGVKRYDKAPSGDLFEFGKLEGPTKKADTLSLHFTSSGEVGYEWTDGAYRRFERGEPFVNEAGDQISVDNVLIEEHEVNFSDKIVDVAGNPSTEIGDVTGTGRAVLFRNGRAVVGEWTRKSEEDPVTFSTRSGDAMVFEKGSIWIELLPSDSGDIKGSFSYGE